MRRPFMVYHDGVGGVSLPERWPARSSVCPTLRIKSPEYRKPRITKDLMYSLEVRHQHASYWVKYYPGWFHLLITYPFEKVQLIGHRRRQHFPCPFFDSSRGLTRLDLVCISSQRVGDFADTRTRWLDRVPWLTEGLGYKFDVVASGVLQITTQRSTGAARRCRVAACDC